ncbi:hypothetical protein HDU91_004962 [Kappamyces sp. JEL0680]|nr:hypothetical protein HDU91_004962 [Kappamyces sp. JEL0680]
MLCSSPVQSGIIQNGGENAAELQNNTDVPSPRAGHSLVLTAPATALLFGGANHEQGFLADFHDLELLHTPETLQLSELKWEKKSDKGCPGARYEHASVLVTRNGKEEMLLLYGAGKDGPLDDVWSYSIEDRYWTKLETRGSKPCARVVRSVGYLPEKGRLYVFGGGLQNSQPVDDVFTYCLDLKSLFWVKVSGLQSVQPRARLGHSLTMVGSSMYLFGGLAHDTALDDLWVFDTNTHKWSLVEVAGLKPTARCAHTCSRLGSKLVVVGGMAPNPSPTVHESVFIFDTAVPDCKRLDHSACVIENEKLLVYGGMNLEHVFQDALVLSLKDSVQVTAPATLDVVD